MIKVAIIGGTGYTGAELLRLLASHPQAEVVYISSQTQVGLPVSGVHRHLRHHYHSHFCSLEQIKFRQRRYCFFCHSPWDRTDHNKFNNDS